MSKQPDIDENLDAEYREMAQDEEREAEALRWAESMIGDVGEPADNSDNQPSE